MHILKTDIDGNPNIGLYCFCNDKFCLVPRGISEKQKSQFEKVLGVPIHEVSIAGTGLIGAFVTGNNSKILVPKIAFENELDKLSELGIKYEILDSELTALGNNIAMTDAGILINPEYGDKIIKQLTDFFNIPAKRGQIEELNTVGSFVKTNGKHGIVNVDCLDFEKKFVENTLKIEISTGTVNFGSKYVSSGLVCNKNGFLVGSLSGGPEIANIDEGLGFLGDEDDV